MPPCAWQRRRGPSPGCRTAASCPSRHIAERDRFAPDFVAIAEAFLGVPYVWGGKTRLGVDCSGLLQVAMHAAGLTCPRDSDMQQAEVGNAVPVGSGLGDLARGDLVFWAGHVGIMLDAVRLLHANAHHMAVAVEPLRVAVDRIAGTGSAITAVKRTLRGSDPSPRPRVLDRDACQARGLTPALNPISHMSRWRRRRACCRRPRAPRRCRTPASCRAASPGPPAAHPPW